MPPKRPPTAAPTHDRHPAEPVVVNLRALPQHWELDPGYVYIGRPGKGFAGPWGNPIKPDVPCRVCGERHVKPADTLPCFEQFLTSLLDDPATSPILIANMASLSGKRLVCFCAPRPCHGDVLARLWRDLHDGGAIVVVHGP